MMILVVEDNEDLRHMYNVALSSEGFEVVEAENGWQALEKLRDVTPELIILDLMMPIMDGWQFLDELRKLPDKMLISVIVCSASKDHVPPNYAYLRKPIELDRLVKLVHQTVSI